ncbi:MAG: hypothetical protein ABI614_10910 [Planctomycetota bacterium]
MSQSVAWRRLWWKEMRQLLPLIVMLPALAFLLTALVLTAGSLNLSGPAEMVLAIIFLGMPGLFAAGVGGLLVGQEKEQRTIQWLNNLPIPPASIWRMKVVTALTGLGIIWGIVMVGYVLLRYMGLPAENQIAALGPAYPLHSLYLLLAGIALSWRFESSLTSVLLVVPAAFVPVAIAFLIERCCALMGYQTRTDITELLLGSQFASSVIAAWLAWRFGLRSLQPQITIARNDRKVRLTPAHVARRFSGTPYSPAAALIWQSARQQRGILFGIFGLFAVAWFADESIGPLLAIAATSWLGVCVFQGDSLHHRIRFLADRGIAPGIVWLTRQVVPLSLLSVALFLLVVSRAFLPPLKHSATLQSFPFLVVLLAAGIVIYAISQWVGQLIASPVVSAIAAPVISMVIVGYGGFAVQSMETPWWLAAGLLTIPVLASYLATRRWMDRRWGWTYWFQQAGWLFALIFIPAIPLLLAVVTEPAMPRQVALAIAEEATRWRDRNVDPRELTMSGADRTGDATIDSDAETLLLQEDQRLGFIQRQFTSTTAPVRISSSRAIEYLQFTAMLARLRIEQADREPADEPIEALATYRETMSMLLQVVERLRLSPRVIEQDVADLLEIWWLKELKRAESRGRLGPELVERSVRLLANTAARQEARRRAIALSWLNYQESQGFATEFGGYPLVDLGRNAGSLRNSLIGQRCLGRAVADLWELSRGARPESLTEVRRRIANYWNTDARRYGLGPNSELLHADDVDVFESSRIYDTDIASQWSAGWEREAASLQLLVVPSWQETSEPKR